MSYQYMHGGVRVDLFTTSDRNLLGEFVEFTPLSNRVSEVAAPNNALDSKKSAVCSRKRSEWRFTPHEAIHKFASRKLALK